MLFARNPLYMERHIHIKSKWMEKNLPTLTQKSRSHSIIADKADSRARVIRDQEGLCTMIKESVS